MAISEKEGNSQGKGCGEKRKTEMGRGEGKKNKITSINLLATCRGLGKRGGSAGSEASGCQEKPLHQERV